MSYDKKFVATASFSVDDSVEPEDTMAFCDEIADVIIPIMAKHPKFGGEFSRFKFGRDNDGEYYANRPDEDKGPEGQRDEDGNGQVQSGNAP